MIVTKKKTFKEKKAFYKKRQEFIDKFTSLYKSDEPIIVEHEGKKYCNYKFGHLFNTSTDSEYLVAMWSKRQNYPVIEELYWYDRYGYSYVIFGTIHIIDGTTPISLSRYNENNALEEVEKIMKKYNIYCFIKEIIE
jgi:hypothetical protein